MKKVSTAAAEQSRNFSNQKLTIGLDLGDRSSWYCVLDERGEVLLEQRLGTTPKAMREVFGGMPRSRIALETGMHSPWVSRVLSELGHEVIVAHATHPSICTIHEIDDRETSAQSLFLHGSISGFGGGLQFLVNLHQELPCPFGMIFHVVSVVLLGFCNVVVGFNDKTLRLCQIGMSILVNVHYRLLGHDNYAKQ
ncbi:hypothetical protein SBA1_790004 [Candidatus Sulfotelmatobacter kueseliae]|uniref:Uncharacterized protein n=1 Tax=Candidatus Sulfotelmatobacter kueseliae TaxID=2042962 RepID=A0A2U3L7G5_9BACT|nr:hypothetical protein SBA1_790004 [Candidatus Sulfotelmatobacter kueseliae]